MWTIGDTDTGVRRAVNQDGFCAETTSSGMILLVCDGMGGPRGGGEASRIAITEWMRQLRRANLGALQEVQVRRVLECAGAGANSAVFEEAKLQGLEGMGTTLTGIVVVGETGHLIHAGDSRAYLLREGLLSRLSTDHTVVQELVNSGRMTREQAERHPKRHYITRAVGVEAELRYDIMSFDLERGDVLLVSSDGLHNEVSEEEIAALLPACVETKDARPLIDRANRNGGSDNITVVIGVIE